MTGTGQFVSEMFQVEKNAIDITSLNLLVYISKVHTFRITDYSISSVPVAVTQTILSFKIYLSY